MNIRLVFVLILLLNTTLSADFYSRTKVEMGTFITISLKEKDKEHIEKGFEILKKVNLSLSSYNKDATIYKLNHKKEVRLDEYAYKALNLCRYYYEKTDGFFDISIGSITKNLYRFGENEKIPTKKELNSSKVNFNGIYFDRFKATLDDKIVVDLGGMGKGFGVDRVAEYFKEQNITEGIISVGGDIRCLGICSIGIQDPFSDKIFISFVTVNKNSSITTSGNYNRYVKSTKHNHLINPKTKRPQQDFISITLISNLPNSDIDAYATAASVMGIKKAYQFLDSLPLAYIILQSDKKIVISKNIADFAKNLSIDYAKK